MAQLMQDTFGVEAKNDALVRKNAAQLRKLY
jgi:hypothetical protein